MILKTAANMQEHGYIEAWKNSDGTTEVKLIPKSGGDVGKKGLKSVTISPEITTAPALDSLFPIYWDDLPEGEIEEGVEYKDYNVTLHTGHALTNGDSYSVSITPTSEWHYNDMDVNGGDGETVTVTKSVLLHKLSIDDRIFDRENAKCISFHIMIME